MENAKEFLKKKAEAFFEYAKSHRERAELLRTEANEWDDLVSKCESDAKEFLAAAEKLS